jgi:uncharacterized membrane protein YkvA (DUF1232 family)
VFSWFKQTGAGASSGGRVFDLEVDVEVLESSVVDEQVLLRLLRRAGRVLAQPALECLELLLDANTPPQVRLTVMAALTYLLMPMDLLPDLLPAVGFSDDLVALTTLLGTCWRHRTPEIRQRAQRRLDHWFPLAQ